MSTKTAFVISKLSPTVFSVNVGGVVKGKLGGTKAKGFRYFGDLENKSYTTQEGAAEALLASLKAAETKKSTKAKKSDAAATDTPKVDEKAEFETKCRVWLEKNHPEQLGAYLPEFTKVLFSLRTRKRFLKEVKDLELAQAMLDFERDHDNRKRQVKYLLSKVNGLVRGTAAKKLTPAQQVAALLTEADLMGTETAPDGEQPKQITVKFQREDGSTVTVLLTVRDIVEDETEEEDDDTDGDDDTPAAE